MRSLLLVSRVVAKKHVIQVYYQKIDFIEKTCPSHNLSVIESHNYRSIKNNNKNDCYQ